MFGPDPKDKIIALLTSQTADLLGLIQKLEVSHAAQVKDLTDKLLAVLNPPAFRAIMGPAEPRPERLQAPSTRANLPGHRPNFRPPSPAETPRTRTVEVPVKIIEDETEKGN